MRKSINIFIQLSVLLILFACSQQGSGGGGTLTEGPPFLGPPTPEELIPVDGEEPLQPDPDPILPVVDVTIIDPEDVPDLDPGPSAEENEDEDEDEDEEETIIEGPCHGKRKVILVWQLDGRADKSKSASKICKNNWFKIDIKMKKTDRARYLIHLFLFDPSEAE